MTRNGETGMVEPSAGVQNGWGHFRLAERAARFGYWRTTLADGKMFWSEGMYRLLGIEPGSVEADANWLLERIRPEDVVKLQENIAVAIRSRAPFTYRTHSRSTDIAAQIVDTHGEVELGADGRVVAVAGVCHDVTAQVTAEAARETAQARYAIMAEEASDVIVLHENGEAVCASGALYRLLGRGPEEMRGGHYLSLVHPDDRDEAAKLIGQPPPGENWTATYRVRHADGHYVWFEVTTRGVYDEKNGSFRHEISVGRDVTARKEQELHLRAAHERAEAANRAKSQFLANMSHELRTPLNAIIGFADIMRHHVLGSPDGGRYDDYANLIHDSAQLLLGHIAGILEMANIEGGKLALSLEAIALKPLIEEGLGPMRERAARNGIALAVDCPERLSFTADKRAVAQILLHLLSNALKFTQAGGRVTVCAKQTRQNIVLAVCDDGVGIAAADIPRLGRPFEQVVADPHIAKGGAGTGLGLALVRALVERHGGTLRIESALGEGTRVFVEFPRDAERSAA